MLVPVNNLTPEAKYDYYRNLKYKLSNSNSGGQYPIKLLMEWDEIRLKLFPNAKQLYAYIKKEDGNAATEVATE